MYGKNPNVAPSKIAVIIIASKLNDVVENTINNDVAEIIVIPSARPSRPSIRFTAFVKI